VHSNEVRRALDAGQPIAGGRVVLLVAPGTGQFAAVAARKIGGAVARNRARRILRAAWREVSPEIEAGHDVILVAREAIRSAKTQDLVAEMGELLRRGELVRA
jgi:ribonuclease P protein component